MPESLLGGTIGLVIVDVSPHLSPVTHENPYPALGKRPTAYLEVTMSTLAIRYMVEWPNYIDSVVPAPFLDKLAALPVGVIVVIFGGFVAASVAVKLGDF